jgi:hypothetical protein
MYTLEVGDDRLVPVNEEDAECIVARLEIVIAENMGNILKEVNLGCRSYREDGVAILQQFLTSESPIYIHLVPDRHPYPNPGYRTESPIYFIQFTWYQTDILTPTLGTGQNYPCNHQYNHPYILCNHQYNHPYILV